MALMLPVDLAILAVVAPHLPPARLKPPDTSIHVIRRVLRWNCCVLFIRA